MKNKTFPTLDKVLDLTTKGLHREHNEIALFERVCKVLNACCGCPLWIYDCTPEPLV